jgi:hypothetical protein
MFRVIEFFYFKPHQAISSATFTKADELSTTLSMISDVQRFDSVICLPERKKGAT